MDFEEMALIRDLEGKEAINTFLSNVGGGYSQFSEHVNHIISTGREVRYIYFVGGELSFAFIYRAVRDLIEVFSKPFGALTYSFSPQDSRSNGISLLKYIKDKYEITFLPPAYDRPLISMFEEAGYFNFGDPCCQNRLIMRSKDEDNLSEAGNLIIGDLFGRCLFKAVKKEIRKN